jgi:hypothetical protein
MSCLSQKVPGEGPSVTGRTLVPALLAGIMLPAGIMLLAGMMLLAVIIILVVSLVAIAGSTSAIDILQLFTGQIAHNILRVRVVRLVMITRICAGRCRIGKSSFTSLMITG